MAKKQAQESEEIKEVGTFPTSPQDIATAFFEANALYDSIIITEDGQIFENSQVGFNAATNHANSANPKLNYQTFNR